MNASNPTTLLHSQLQAARNACATLQSLLDRTSALLADRCSVAGRLQAQSLDAYQLASYELAMAKAELAASAAVLAATSEDAEALDLRLALIYVAEAAQSIALKLETTCLELESDPAELRDLLHSPTLTALRRFALSGAALAETAGLLTASDRDIGHVVLDEGLSMAQSQFRRLAAEVVAPWAERIHREDLTVPEDLLQAFRAMGVFGLSIPETYGGSSPGAREDNLMMIVVTEALSEASLGAAGSLITRPEILSRALLAGGTEAQKSHWLPRIAAGDPLCAIAITEPDFGSDVASLALRATRTEGGWLLNGAKTWCTFAGKAGLIMVVARTGANRAEGHRGLSVLLVEKPSYEGHAFAYNQEGGGLLSGKAIPTIGYRGMHSFDLAFEDFFVPDTNVIGGEAGVGKGFYFTMAGMTGGRMQTAARAVGLMRAALRSAMQYARDRKVFGAPLIDYQLTQAKLVKMAARLAACRQFTYAVGHQLNAGGGRMEANLAKLLSCRAAEWLTREAMQIFGGLGYAEETPVSRYFVDARVLSIFEGAEETLALKVIARTMLEDAIGMTAR